MSEQAVLAKSGAKSKDKTSLLSGLLKAGKIDVKDSAEFVKKLLELTKKGEVELETRTTKGKKSELVSEEIDAAALLQIKNLLSQIKLNDKLGIEKTIKNLRELSDKEGKKAELPDLKKLLEVAKEGGLGVKKIEVERVDEESLKSEIKSKKSEKNEQKKVEPDLKHAAKERAEVSPIVDEAAKKEALLKLSKEIKELPKEVVVGEQKKVEKKEPKSTKEDSKKDEELKLKKDGSLLAQALQESRKEESKKEPLPLSETPKKEPKHAKEEPKKEESVKSAKEGVKSFDGGVMLQKALETREQFGESKNGFLKDEGAQKESRKEESGIKKQPSHFEIEGAHKAEPQELKAKMAAASEGLKNLSKDLWETVENYRPPLMKVSMELNPQNLGSVDVTLISRGQNLIVNVSSGQETMQMFMQNIQEFRQNLMAQGFVSLQMNFNFSDQKGDGQNRQWQKEAAKKYAANGEDIGKIESLDIVVPHPRYA